MKTIFNIIVFSILYIVLLFVYSCLRISSYISKNIEKSDF